MRRGILKTIGDFQTGWTIKCDNMGGTSIIVSLKTDEIVQIGWLTGSENFVGNKTQLIVYCMLSFIGVVI